MRILIVDDHEVVRRGVRSLLSRKKDVVVCGEAVDGQDAIAKAQALKPDVITMDISMPHLNGLEATREIRRMLPEVQILILSQHDVPEMMRQALSAGANGYVVKSAISTELIAALEKMRYGQGSFDQTVFGSAQQAIDTQEILQRSTAFEKALRESQSQLALALDSSNTAMFEWDIATSRGKWNAQMTRIYGFTPPGDEMDSEAWYRLFHPDDKERLLREAEAVFRNNEHFQFEYRVIRPDQSVHWILSKGRVIRDAGGQPVRLIGTHVDITDRKNTEEALARGLRRQAALTSLAEQLHEGKTLEDVYCAAFDAIFSALQCDRASILLYDHTGVMHFVSWRGLSDAYRKATDGHSPWKRDEKNPAAIAMENVASADLDEGLRRIVLGEGIRALAFIPLISQGKLIGKFMVYYNAPHAFTKEETDVSLAIARQLAFGIERRRAEQALRESEEHFRAIVEASPECVMLVGPDGTLLHMNSVGLKMIGATRAAAVLGNSVYELVDETDRETFRKFNQRVCAGENASLEFELMGLDGSRRHVETRAVPLWNPDGTVVELAVARDISERRLTERELAEKARLIDLSNDAILVRDAADRITFWNQGATEIYGYTREEALGRVSHDLLQTRFPEPPARIMEKLLRHGRWSGELRHVCADGSEIVVSTRWSLERDTDGNVGSILESNRNITEINKARQAQYRLAAIVECSDDAIVSKDLNGVIMSWNAAAERIFGFTPEEAIGKPITIIIPPELQDQEQEILGKLRAGQRIDHFETIRQTKNGERRNISLTISPVRDSDGRIIGASKIARDITERKRMEQVLKEVELSGRLLHLQDEERRRVARELHDGVGQLLAALSMNISTIEEEKSRLSADAARGVEENRSLIQQAIAEVRTISHLLHPPFLDEVGLKSALMEYVTGFAQRSNIQVTLDLPAELDRLAHECELSLFRIVQESLTNIHRHSGSETAQVRLTRTAGEIRLEIADQGRGIGPEIQQKLAAGKSAGVGLRGMRERVRQMGGSLEIQSDTNGTCIVVVLPLQQTKVAGNPPQMHNGEQPSPKLSAATVPAAARIAN